MAEAVGNCSPESSDPGSNFTLSDLFWPTDNEWGAQRGATVASSDSGSSFSLQELRDNCYIHMTVDTDPQNYMQKCPLSWGELNEGDVVFRRLGLLLSHF